LLQPTLRPTILCLVILLIHTPRDYTMISPVARSDRPFSLRFCDAIFTHA